MFYYFLVLCSLLFAPMTDAHHVTRYERLCLPHTEVRHLHSRITGLSYKLYINIPSSFHASRKKYPTLYLLDADYSFSLVKQIGEHLSDRRRIQALLVVGIAYDGPENYRLNRTRDYTISHTLVDGYSPKIQQQSGGAHKFLQFIKQELVPYIESSYPTNGSRGIVGHSLGGLFASWSLLESPELFDKYLIISASLWYDHEKILEMAKTKMNFNQTIPHQVFMAIGGKENANYPMIDEQNKFLWFLGHKNHKNLLFYSQIFNYFDHDMIVPAAISRGLVVLYGI